MGEIVLVWHKATLRKCVGKIVCVSLAQGQNSLIQDIGVETLFLISWQNQMPFFSFTKFNSDFNKHYSKFF